MLQLFSKNIARLISLHSPHKHHQPRWLRSSLGLVQLFGAIAVGVLTPSIAHALSPSAVSITFATDPLLVSDANGCSGGDGPRAAYVGFNVSNTSGSTLNNLQANVSGFVSGFSLAGGQPQNQYIGTLAVGASRTVYWYISYPCHTNTIKSNTLTATISDTSSGVAIATQTVTSNSSIKANAGGLVTSSVLGAGAVVGQIIEYDVTYSFGNVSPADRFNLQPSGKVDFNAGCLQLQTSRIVSSGVNAISAGTTDKLFFTANANQGGSGNPVTVRYFFLYRCDGVSTTANPYASQTSGSNNIKYTSNFGGTPVNFPSASNPFTISKSASAATLPTGGTVNYTVTINNTSSFTALLDRITDTLPAGVTYGGLAAGSQVTAANSSSLPTTGATGTINWIGMPFTSYSVPAGGSIMLKYTANVPNTSGTYTNSVNATAGQSTTGSATANVGVGSADLSISKTHTGDFTQGQTGATYTLTVTNSGNASTTSNVTVTDTLPVGLLPTAASGTGWTCNISSQTVTCTRTTFTVLTSGSSYPPITITVSVINSAPNNVINTARVSGGGQTNTANDTFNDSTTINASAIPNPLACDGEFYQIRVTTGSQLFRINRTITPYTQTQLGNITPVMTLNGLGYNKLDGFMYAIRTNTNHLYRIDQNGAVFLGAVTGLTSADYNTGAFDSAGNYYVKVSGLNSNIYKIDVSTLTATAITLNQSIDLGDMAFHPTDGAIYGLRDATAYKIVLGGTAGTVTTIGNTSLSSSSAIGSAFFDSSGALYGYENGGTFYIVNTTTGNATNVSSAPNTAASDGASCPFTSPERVINVVKSVGTLSPVNSTTFNVPYSIVVKNIGTDVAPNTQINEKLDRTFSTGAPTLAFSTGAPTLALTSAPTLALTSAPTVTNGSCTTNSSFNGTSDTRLLIGTNTLPVSGTCTITFTVRVTYPNQASVPNTAQNNTAYASSIFNGPNSGYTFTNGAAVPPPVLLTGDQSTVSINYPSDFILVKRITRINTTDINGFVDGPDSNDNNPNWPANYLRGAIAQLIQPGDVVEYTIYFLSDGGSDVTNVKMCDLIPANTSFVSTAFNGSSPTDDGLPTDLGIVLALGSTTPTAYLTNVADPPDRGQFFSPGTQPPAACKEPPLFTSPATTTTNIGGAVVVNVATSPTTVPKATAPGTPTNSYGFVRFRVRVN